MEYEHQRSITGVTPSNISVVTFRHGHQSSDPYDLLNSDDPPTMDPMSGYPYPSLYGWVHIVAASVVVTAIMLIIVVGNSLVVLAISIDRNLTGLQNWFIASLAVSDFLVGLFIMPLSLANELMGYWIFGDVLCELWLATDVLLCTASILNLCLISLDRYWSITRVISYVKLRTKTRAGLMISLVWIASMIICLPPLVGWKRPQPTKHGYIVFVIILVYYKISIWTNRSKYKQTEIRPPLKTDI